MLSYKILECDNLQDISKELYAWLLDNRELSREDIRFWNFLDKQKLFDLTKKCEITMSWFESMNLKVREGSFTIWNEFIRTSPHVDAPPVVAKINVPVLNTEDTYNVWFDKKGNEIDRIECIDPIVLRSDILHTVEIGKKASLPRIQMSFCFYNEPIKYLE